MFLFVFQAGLLSAYIIKKLYFDKLIRFVSNIPILCNTLHPCNEISHKIVGDHSLIDFHDKC